MIALTFGLSLPCGGSLQRSTSLTNRADVVRPPRSGRTIPLLHFNGMSQKTALRMARQPSEPLKTIRGLSRLPPVVIANPGLHVGISRKRSPVMATATAGGKKDQGPSPSAAPLRAGRPVGPTTVAPSSRSRPGRQGSPTPPSNRHRH